jgi:fructan beta-fructosidase
MNDPNGMVYLNGEYHLFYQYNPYGIVWGSMYWGHAVSKDLVHWEHLPIALSPDALGTIFSGSAVIDKDNTAGFGAGALIAIYTCSGSSQTQCLAYSTDNGRTFTKYTGNPVLTASVSDFRDPKVFWYEPTKHWIMILAAGQEMWIYSSPDLKTWTHESNFGYTYGAHGGVWECPDLFGLPVEGTQETKWVLISNLNPGGPFGGSATQYFIGEFDGKQFVCDDEPSVTRWMDFGKDHYATVTWNNVADGRRIALPWMSNWQYADKVPATDFRGSDGIPRELGLSTATDGNVYLKTSPVKEVELLQSTSNDYSFSVDKTASDDVVEPIPVGNGAYEVNLSIRPLQADTIAFYLCNDENEKVTMHYDFRTKKFFMDRRNSGKTEFNKDFPAITDAPLRSVDETITLRLIVDKTSVEAFGDNGYFSMTNLVYPSQPYNRIAFEPAEENYEVSLKMYAYQ